jgi:hypothetical protein
LRVIEYSGVLARPLTELCFGVECTPRRQGACTVLLLAAVACDDAAHVTATAAVRLAVAVLGGPPSSHVLERHHRPPSSPPTPRAPEDGDDADFASAPSTLVHPTPEKESRVAAVHAAHEGTGESEPPVPVTWTSESVGGLGVL